VSADTPAESLLARVAVRRTPGERAALEKGRRVEEGMWQGRRAAHLRELGLRTWKAICGCVWSKTGHLDGRVVGVLGAAEVGAPERPAAIGCSRLVRRAWTCYRWEGRTRREVAPVAVELRWRSER
jgi:hypothetical protein